MPTNSEMEKTVPITGDLAMSETAKAVIPEITFNIKHFLEQHPHQSHVPQ